MHPISYRHSVFQYIEKIQLLGFAAEQGESIQSAVEIVVNDACKFFLQASDDSNANLGLFKNELIYRATYAQDIQPEYRTTLQYAASLIADRED